MITWWMKLILPLGDDTLLFPISAVLQNVIDDEYAITL